MRRFRNLVALAAILAGLLVPPPQPAVAQVTLTVTPITWNVLGLDSNDPVNAGPENFPVGVRVCNTGAVGEDATGVTARLFWDSSNAYIALRPGSLGSTIDPDVTAPVAIGGLPGGGACRDVYFEVSVDRTTSAYDTSRRYHIVVDSVETDPVSTPTNRELYVEHLISQSRNNTSMVTLDGVDVPAGGTMALVVGSTYNIELTAYTATNGYEQIETFINFNNTIFQINSVHTTYTAPPGAE